ncbi:MAG: putative metallopeptidase [Candidatus Aenigmatarchaeota archaeon]
MKFEPAPDIQERIAELVEKLPFSHIDAARIKCFRSSGSTSRANARIWSLPRIWQKALEVKAHYVIEVLAERFDSYGKVEQDKILIHELMHIPKTFSGALVPHFCFGKRINSKSVEEMYKKLDKNSRI